MNGQLTMIDIDLSRQPSSSVDRDALSRLPAARLLRDLLRGGMPLEAVPFAARLVVELEELAVEDREREREGWA